MSLVHNVNCECIINQAYIIVHTVISIHSHTFIFVVSTASLPSLLILCMTFGFVPFIFPLFIKQISKPLLGPLLIDFGVFYSRCVLSHISYLLLFTKIGH